MSRLTALTPHGAALPPAAPADAVAKSAGWQPIETAPKDALVDVFNNGRRYASCHYDVICREFRHITACGVLIRLKNATHWMPLPAAPDAAMQGKESGK